MKFILVSPPKGATRKADKTAASAAAAQAVPASVKLQSPTSTADVFTRATTAIANTLTGANRRWTPRADLNRTGWISGSSLSEPVKCTVCNTSKHGAMLELAANGANSSSDAIPNLLTLVWVSGRVRSEANCTVRWRSRTIIGVNFIGPVRTSLDRRG